MSEPNTAPRIAEMVGVSSQTASTAAGGGGNRRRLGKEIEAAMSAEVHKISDESTAIWNDPALSIEEKNRRIAELNSDENKRKRMLAARDAVKAGARAEVETKHAAAEVARLEEQLAAAKARQAGAKQ